MSWHLSVPLFWTVPISVWILVFSKWNDTQNSAKERHRCQWTVVTGRWIKTITAFINAILTEALFFARACVVVLSLRFGAFHRTGTRIKCLWSEWKWQREEPFEHGGPEPKHWIQAKQALPFTARQGAAKAESGPGGGAGHIPVLRLRQGGRWDQQCAGSRWERTPSRFWEAQTSTKKEKGVGVLRGRHYWWLCYSELHQFGGFGGTFLHVTTSIQLSPGPNCSDLRQGIGRTHFHTIHLMH